MADPTFAKLAGESPMLLMETGCTCAYTAIDDTFTRSVPGANEVALKLVGRIDAALLNGLDIASLKEL